MKLNKLIVNLNEQLKSQKPRYESGDPYMILKVEPKDKALVAFLINLASRSINGHYNTINTGIKSQPFDYELEGAPDEVKLDFDYKAFRDGKTLQSQIVRLLSEVTALIKEISTGWTPAGTCFFEGEEKYENPNISGTYYVFLLQQVAINLEIDVMRGYFPGSNALSFDTWLPYERWQKADKMTIKGRPILITQFITALAEELHKINDFELNDKVTPPQGQIKISASKGHTSINASNITVEGDLNISLSNGYNGAFIQILTKQNQRDAKSTQVVFDHESNSYSLS